MLPGVSLAEGKPCPPSPLSVAGGSSVITSCAAGDPEADWIARSTGPGVVWANDFRRPEEVDSFVYWSGSDTRRDVWLTGDRRVNVPGPFQIPEEIKDLYPTGDGIPGTGGGSLNCHLPVGDKCRGNWARPFSAFTGLTNGRGVNDPAAQGLVPLRTWDTHASSRDRVRHWTKSHYAHPDNWRLPNGQPDPIRALASGFEREGEEFWLQFRYKVPKARFGPNEPDGKLLIINPNSSGTQLADSEAGQIVPESNRNGTLFAFINRKAVNFGDLTDPQGAHTNEFFADAGWRECTDLHSHGQ